jgi:hypothetical protein
MLEKITEAIEDFTEIFKEKEYVCYYRTTAGFIEKVYLTKKELVKFLNKHPIADVDAYKIKDKVEIERKISIKEDEKV